MLGSYLSADAVAWTDSRGMLRHPFFIQRWQSPLIGTGIKAINPGGAGAQPPPPGSAQHSLPTTQSQGSVFSIAMQPDGAEPLTQAPAFLSGAPSYNALRNLVEDAVSCEPFSGPKFPANREIYREFRRFPF